jgi:lactate dehydrogenase-like 2-hydroxyacid dehydrogenase
MVPRFCSVKGKGIRALLSLGIEQIDDPFLAQLPDLELIAVVGAG